MLVSSAAIAMAPSAARITSGMSHRRRGGGGSGGTGSVIGISGYRSAHEVPYVRVAADAGGAVVIPRNAIVNLAPAHGGRRHAGGHHDLAAGGARLDRRDDRLVA